MNENFCHLHVHTEFSLLDGFGTAKQYVSRAKKLGQKYIGITDHGSIDGIIKFQKECKKQSITPILGCEAYIVKNSFIKEKGEKRRHVTLLIKTEEGFQNLCKMLTFANLTGFYHRPRIDYDLIYHHCDGLIILTGCYNSFLLDQEGINLFLDLKEKIGDDLYLEVMPHMSEEQYKINSECISLANKYDIPLVASNDCHYVNKDDDITQEVLLAIQSKAKWTDKDRFKFKVKELYLKSIEEMESSFIHQNILTKKEIDEAFYSTIEIAQKCKNFSINKKEIYLPKVPQYEDVNPNLYIHSLCQKRLIDLQLDKDTIYVDRLNEEISMIKSKKFSSYFLTIWELITWCKQQNIMTGPGRGSAAGSLVAFLLGITTVDPIKYNLLFSRFISENRIDLPDVDIDFEDSKRNLVREHLENLYGKNHISSISTFLTMKGRMVIRDVSRVFDIPAKEVDTFAKSIEFKDDNQEDIIESSIKNTNEGKIFNQRYPEVVKHAMKLEGQIRASGQHAAALIISADDLTQGTKGNLVSRTGSIVSNWDMEDSEYMGLMKLDVLGLNTLSVLSEAKRLIKQNHNKEIIFEDIDLNDSNIYKDISEGYTVGIFQLSGWSTTKLAKDIKADNFSHLSDVIALSRPGPYYSGQTDEYIKRKFGQSWVRKHSIYEKITEKTYGIIVYQEQIMEVINKVAGLPYSTADQIRKIISKKRTAKEFKPYKDSFIEGCQKQKTLSNKEAEIFWSELQQHASYSFNLSHSVSYAMLGFWTSYMKYYYPTEFICASLTYGSDGKKEEIIEEAYRIGLQVILPKVGISDAFNWVAKDNKLYCPFIEIKGIGEKSAKSCMNVKQKTGISSIGFFNTTKKLPEGKIEKLLTEIGAFGNEPIKNTDKYFSFKIINNKEYPELNKKVGIKIPEEDLEIYLNLNLSKRYSLQLIKKTVFCEKNFYYFLPECRNCELGDETDLGPVPPSSGKYNIIILGEAPGKNEDEEGKCFVGKAGNDILWRELDKYELLRTDFHVTNCCKCFPSKSKTPNKKQIEICYGWLVKEIKAINPCLILAFGNTSVRSLTGRDGGITDLSGKTEWSEKLKCWICWSIHPSSVLHNPLNKKYFEDGIKNFSEKITLLGDLK